MDNRILGIHHITAIAGNAQRNFDFYTKVLGLRLVKKTVNFDDPGTYHLYYGNEVGSPGTILTFFPWERVRQGRNGAGMATEIGYSVPASSLHFWQERFKRFNVRNRGVSERLGQTILPFEDPDGLQLTLIADDADKRTPWQTNEVKQAEALRGFHSATLTLRNMEGTAGVLTDIFGYRLQSTEGNRHRFVTDAADEANVIDLLELPTADEGLNAGGTNHHIAFRARDDKQMMEFHDQVASRGLHITGKIDRNYFYSLYFREPGGVLFEIASDNPGFAIDETVDSLGTMLKLPPQYESHRSAIESHLPLLK